MPSTASTKLGGAMQSVSPKKGATRPPPPTKPTLSSIATDVNNTLANVTVKGSRRAQGWHSAVGGGPTAGIGSIVGSNALVGETNWSLDSKALTQSRTSSGMPRRLSVQFSEDTLGNHQTPRAPSKPQLPPANKDDAAFRQNMADFLSVMYGDRTSSSGTGAASGGSGGSMPPTAKGKSGGVSNAGADKSEVAPKQSDCSPHLVPSGVKGPLVKGLTANGSRHGAGDRIDTLVDTLVRAYSRQAISSRGDFQGAVGGPDDDNANLYNRPRHQNYRRAVASSRPGQGSGHGGIDTKEVSVFVSQAMDTFIGPGGLRQQGLPSTRSVLSSLGVDKNIFGLMSFETRSNMQEVDAVEDGSETKLEPMYVGEQALFKSVGTRPNMNDISVSKSMRGVIPASSTLEEELAKEGGGVRSDTAQRRVNRETGARRNSNGPLKNHMNNSNLSLNSETDMGRRDGNGGQQDSPAVQRGAARRLSVEGNGRKSITRCMSLDSKALGAGAGNGGGDDEDDSWGDDATAPPTIGAPVLVSSARSLLNYSKVRHNVAFEKTLTELFEEEKLKRDVVMAVERQLRGYIVSLEQEERGKKKSRKCGAANS